MSRLESQLYHFGLISRMCCRFCHFEFQRAGNYTRNLGNKHPKSAAVSVPAHFQPVGNHKEIAHAYPNTTIFVSTSGRQKRGFSYSFMSDDIASKPPKRHAETGALLSGSCRHSQEESKSSRTVVGSEGAKRFQNMGQTSE